MDITLSDATYDRLATLARGFETPEQVINRLIDAVQADPKTKPQLLLCPADEDEFRNALLVSKQAKVEMFKKDGTCETGIWKARSISSESNILSNIWSGYLRNWKEKGIVRAVFTVQDDPAVSDVVDRAEWKDYTINRISSGSIELLNKGVPLNTTIKPILRNIANELGISPDNGNGNEMNSRQLGGVIIKRLNGA